MVIIAITLQGAVKCQGKEEPSSREITNLRMEIGEAKLFTLPIPCALWYFRLKSQTL